MTISIIVAQAENRAIGKDNKMLWHLPKEFAYFKKNTVGHHLIMGRKNFESIGKPLPGRTSIIVTRNTTYKTPHPDVWIAESIPDALKIAQKNGEEEAFIIGGGEIYDQTIEVADKLYLTTVHKKFDADVFFPEIDFDDWKKLSSTKYKADKMNKIDFTTEVYERIDE